MDKEQIKAISESIPMEQRFSVEQIVSAAIESYKAELLKEVGEPVGYLHQWIEYHPYGDTVAGEPCSAITNDGKPFDKSDTVTLLFTSDQVAAAIESYKAELLKEVGEPAAHMIEHKGKCMGFLPTKEQGTIPVFTSDQVSAAILKATKPMEDQLAAAQEEIRRLEKLVISAQNAAIENGVALKSTQDQLAKAEQRVAEACAAYITSGRYMILNPGESISSEQHIQYLKNHDIYQANCLRSSEWRKFVKEV